MRVDTILTVVFAAIVSAEPLPWAAPQASIVPSVNSKIGGSKSNGTRHRHHEPTPSFKAACNCQKPIIPNILSSKEKCLMDFAASVGCFISSKGGCPSPAPACGMNAQNIIPLDARAG